MEAAPPLRPRFFYASNLALDDPLSPVPPPVASTATNKSTPRPFSQYDNARLEEAWQELRKSIAAQTTDEQGSERHGHELQIPTSNDHGPRSAQAKGSTALQNGYAVSWNKNGTVRRTLQATTLSLGTSPVAALLNSSVKSPVASEERSAAVGELLAFENDIPATTGNPFVRAPSRSKVTTSVAREPSGSRPRPQPLDSYLWDDDRAPSQTPETVTDLKEASAEIPSKRLPVGVSRLHQVSMPALELEPIYWAPVNDVAPVVRATWFYRDNMMPVEVPVANMLELGYTELQVWTQTWQDELSSAVEVGAAGEERILRSLWPAKVNAPYSRPSTSQGEMTSSIRSLRLDDPETPEEQRKRLANEAREIIQRSAGEEAVDNSSSGSTVFGKTADIRTYPSAAVIYENATTAHILKPSLQPSAYYSRRPLANYIRKGRGIGVPVIRGFDQKLWDKLYPPPKGSKSAKAYAGASASESGGNLQARQQEDPQLSPAITPKVTDLVFVIHGIGQKLSERMESWHFTHAMNGFRREANVELGTDEVRKRLRRDAGGIMVLPVNWRHTLSFEDGGYRQEMEDHENNFNLKDITPETLPSVRNIVSDVMLDIPYYLSHHQPKMIAAVIREANRIYKLWCSNNPDFASNGRVHIIAHSLGSVMAIDVLSNQPSHLPPSLQDPVTADLTDLDHFAFNVTNLFCAGSPAGFFLLLKHAPIRPRIDRRKPGGDEEALTPLICGKQGDYGCLAVDNLYNIINPYDPVSYRMNATVDRVYAATLRPAWLPSATPGWFSSYTSSASDSSGGSMGGWFGGGGGSSSSGSSQKPQRPPMADRNVSSVQALATPFSGPSSPELMQRPANGLPRLPSNVELETHNFSREETAERRMLLVNDTGQVDFLLKYGGGPLEIQYLTMLSAHSSYWLLKDFVRAIVVECGREPGRRGVIKEMRAVKRRGV